MTNKHAGSHETLHREENFKASSDRGFALVFGGISTIVAIYGSIVGSTWWPWPVGVAAVFFILAFTVPSILAPLNKAWTKLGLLMFAFISPLVLGLLFYLCVTPIGLLMRACRKDPLRLKHDAKAPSYWIAREPPGPSGDSLKNQF